MGVHDRLFTGLGVSYLPSSAGHGTVRVPLQPRAGEPRTAGGGGMGSGTTGQGRHRTQPDADAVPLMAFALRLTGGDRERAELVVAETLAYAVEHAPPPGARRRPWLIATARRFAADDRWPEREPTDRVRSRMAVNGALGTLSRPHREILTETYFRGRTIAEAADALDLPVVTAQTRLAYALRALRNSSTG
jgi:RNA polymerase sigma-70 factor (ECF subfamily)